MKVYLVQTIQNDSHDIVTNAVCSTPEKADNFIQRFLDPSVDAFQVEWDIDVADQLPPKSKVWTVRFGMFPPDQIFSVYPQYILRDLPSKPVVIESPPSYSYVSMEITSIVARTKSQAIKIAKKVRREYLRQK